MQIELEAASQERGDDEMDVSDEEEAIPRKRTKVDLVQDENVQLKDENNALRMQMEAYKNEVTIFYIFKLFHSFATRKVTL